MFITFWWHWYNFSRKPVVIQGMVSTRIDHQHYHHHQQNNNNNENNVFQTICTMAALLNIDIQYTIGSSNSITKMYNQLESGQDNLP